MSVMVDIRPVHKRFGTLEVDQGAISVDGTLIGYRRSGDRLYELPERGWGSPTRPTPVPGSCPGPAVLNWSVKSSTS